MAARKEPGDGTPGSFPSRFGSKSGEIRSQIQPLSAKTELSDEEKGLPRKSLECKICSLDHNGGGEAG